MEARLKDPVLVPSLVVEEASVAVTVTVATKAS